MLELVEATGRMVSDNTFAKRSAPRRTRSNANSMILSAFTVDSEVETRIKESLLDQNGSNNENGTKEEKTRMKSGKDEIEKGEKAAPRGESL